MLLLFEDATFCSHIPKNEASCALSSLQTESTVAYIWRELQNVLYSSLDSYTYSLELTILNPGIEGQL